MMATNSTDATDDVNSDHDIDTEHESSLSEVMCPNGKHKWKHDQCKTPFVSFMNCYYFFILS